MRGTDRRLGRQFLLGTVALTLSGCGLSGRSVEQRIADGSALTDIRRQVDGHPQCLPLISGNWPIEFSGDMLRRDSVDVLVAAGLFLRAPARPDRPDAALRLVPLPLGKQSLRLTRSAGFNPTPELCFGKMHVTSVRAVHPGKTLSGAPDDSTWAVYRYRLVDVPAWARRADMLAAFPFLTAMTRNELASSDTAEVEHGRLRLSNLGGDLPRGFENARFASCSLHQGTNPRCG